MYSSKRLRKECQALCKSPIDYVKAHPLESNILEWHYVIIGVPGTPFEGGYYHGLLRFPQEYPLKPPLILMYTPNGRFLTNRRICVSMSDFHPESWNPMWSVSTILIGLQSFMMDNSPAVGTVVTSIADKRKLARNSLTFNCRNKLFVKLFPDLVELYQKAQEEEAAASASAMQGKDSGGTQQQLNNGNTAAIAKEGNNKEVDLPPRDLGGGNMVLGLMLPMAIATVLLAMIYVASFT